MQVIPLDALLVLLSLWGLAGVSNNNLEKCLRPNTESIQDKELEQGPTAEALHNHFDKVSHFETKLLTWLFLQCTKHIISRPCNITLS